MTQDLERLDKEMRDTDELNAEVIGRYADNQTPVVYPFMDVEGIKPITKLELAAQVSGRVIEVHDPKDTARSYSQFDEPEQDSDIQYDTANNQQGGLSG